jgi:hypothetical protein
MQIDYNGFWDNLPDDVIIKSLETIYRRKSARMNLLEEEVKFIQYCQDFRFSAFKKFKIINLMK